MHVAYTCMHVSSIAPINHRDNVQKNLVNIYDYGSTTLTVRSFRKAPPSGVRVSSRYINKSPSHMRMRSIYNTQHNNY